MHTDDLNEKLNLMLKLETKVPGYFPRDAGVWKYSPNTESWEGIFDIPEFAVGDIETKKIPKTRVWVPVLGVFLDECGNWYIWNADPRNTYEDCPDVLIGHNALEHDTKFLSVHSDCLVIDTMILMRELFGVPEDKQKAYKKLQQNHAKGLGVPEWFHMVSGSSLKESCKFLLGEELKITKKDGLANYCAHDVYATLRIAQRLIPLALSEGMEIYHEVRQ
jgi:hypothetical protein